jgi:hypothetical protein
MYGGATLSNRPMEGWRDQMALHVISKQIRAKGQIPGWGYGSMVKHVSGIQFPVQKK